MRGRWLIAALALGCGSDGDGDGWPGTMDCDDADPAVHPAAAERCNGVDDDCDGLVDAGAVDAAVWFADADQDGAGDPTAWTLACQAPDGAVDDASDCDDTDPAVNAGAVEACNGRDDDCDGHTDEDATSPVPRYRDQDGDGHGDPEALVTACVAPADAVSLPDDCDDADGEVHPGAVETCDGRDEDCDERVDEDAIDALSWFPDFDGDGFGWTAVEVAACDAPPGYVADGTDCDDFDPANHPGADERCDFVDNDCDAAVDGPDAVDPRTWYRDIDGDGFGSSTTATACAPPDGYVGLPGDCNDVDPDAFPGHPEVCDDDVDDDCNGVADACDDLIAVFGIDDVAVAAWSGVADDGLESVASAGDVDGDGFDDLLLGSPAVEGGGAGSAGAVWVAHGAAALTGATDVDALPAFTGVAGNDRLTLHRNLAGVGDLDGDGLADWLVGGPDVDAPGPVTDAGVVGLRYGNTARDAGVALVDALDATFRGPTGSVRLGHGVAGLGDVDGDGLDDAAFASSENPAFAGTVSLLYGDAVRLAGASSPDTPTRITGQPGDSLGYQQGVAGADLDGDGLADVAMAATGAVVLLYGAPARPGEVSAADLPRVTEGASTEEFGAVVRPGGDLDGDGLDDLVVADSSYTSVGGPASGQVWLVGGRASRVVGAEALVDLAFATVDGVEAAASCGWDARALGDFSGDGPDDLAVSALAWGAPYAQAGAVGVFHGPLSGSVRFDAADARLEGAAGGAFLGYAVAAADVDGDGWVDLAATAPGAAGGRGRAYLVLGGTW